MDSHFAPTAPVANSISIVPGPATPAGAIPGLLPPPGGQRGRSATVGLRAVGIYLRKEVDPLELSEWAHFTLYVPHS